MRTNNLQEPVSKIFKDNRLNTCEIVKSLNRFVDFMRDIRDDTYISKDLFPAIEQARKEMKELGGYLYPVMDRYKLPERS